MYLLSVHDTTLFAKFEDVYPECFFYIDDEPQLHPLICYLGPCHRAQNCQEKIAKRVLVIFEAFPEAQLLLLYFTYRDKPGSYRAGVYWRDMREPRYITFNRAAWEKMKEVGELYEWDFPEKILW